MQHLSNPLITALTNPKLYNYPVANFEIVETHISWILLTGPYAYKIKKPVDLGFLDFSTLEKRKTFCFKELFLNRRFAPEIYLDVIPITGSEDNPRLDDEGPIVEFAVKMRQFPSGNLLENLVAKDQLGIDIIDELAEQIASFHADAAVATAVDNHGRASDIHQAVEQNFEKIRPFLNTSAQLEALQKIEEWSRKIFRKTTQAFRERKENGFIRECHGDLHLGNIVLLNNRPTLFDCIEFNENLRWIDVMSEIAFVVMDLQLKQRSDLAFRLLNRYLEITGDYRGVKLLRYYLVYRAMVRAKITKLTLVHAKNDACLVTKQKKRFRDYVDLALALSQPHKPALIITHGFSGSGKSYISERIAEQLPAIRVRSDVERKRLAGLQASSSSGSSVSKNIYHPDFTRKTYRHLQDIAEMLLTSGFSVILDATFLNKDYRRAQRRLAEKNNCNFLILDFSAPVDVLEDRVSQRITDGKDVSEAGIEVLKYQISHQDPLEESEKKFSLSVASSNCIDAGAITDQIQQFRNVNLC